MTCKVESKWSKLIVNMACSTWKQNSIIHTQQSREKNYWDSKGTNSKCKWKKKTHTQMLHASTKTYGNSFTTKQAISIH